MSNEQEPAPAEGDPIDHLDFQLQRFYEEEGLSLPFDTEVRGKRVSDLLPKLVIKYGASWQHDYPTPQAFADAFNRRMQAKKSFYGGAHLVIDTPNAHKLTDSLRFRSIN